MGIGEIGYVSQIWQGTVLTNLLAAALVHRVLREELIFENKMLFLENPYCLVIVKLVIFMKHTLQQLLTLYTKTLMWYMCDHEKE